MGTGICRRCACNWVTPCINEKYGPCWWVDKNRTLCSHCFYGFNDESCQTKVYYRPGHDWLERDWEFAGAENRLSHGKKKKAQLGRRNLYA